MSAALEPVQMATMVEFGPYRLDLAEERVWKGAKQLAVRRKPFAILRYLVGNPRRLVTHEELLQHVWSGTTVSESAVRTHLHELRQLLGEGVIETVIGRGYRFTADLVQATAAVAPAAHAPGLAIVGREQELAVLRGALERASSGHRQLCFVTGDPGIGKTTLVDAFLDEVERAGAVHARGQCIEQHGAPEAYLAVIEMLVALCARGGESTIGALVRYAPTFLQQVPHLCPANQLAEITQRAGAGSDSRLARELIEAIEAIASQTTIVVVLEDLQWSDLATIDLLALLGQRRERAKLLVIATSRHAETQTIGHPLHQLLRPLILRSGARAVSLERFSSEAVRALVDARFPPHEFPASFVDTIEHVTAGSPLFVTSLLDDLAMRGMLVERDGAWRLAVATEELAAYRPDSIKQLIDIQLDRLTPPEQRVLEAASAVGIEPATVLIAAALELPEEAIDEVCDGLARRSLFLRRAPVDELPDGTLLTRYGVIHGLVQEVCLARCAVTRRQRWHRLIAERLEGLYGERAGEVAHVLARHFDEGRVPARAIHYYILAAERAARRFAGPDTLVLFKRAQQLVMKTPADRERDATELRILQGLASTTLRTSPSTDPLAMFDRMIELATELGDTATVCSALINASIRHSTLCNYRRGAELIREAEERARPVQLGEQLANFKDVARVLPMIWCGELAPALAVLDEINARSVPAIDQRLGILGPTDRRVVLYAYDSLLRWLLGFPDRAITSAERALGLARETGDPFALGLAHCNLARTRIVRGDPVDSVREPAEQVLAMPLAFVWHSAARLLVMWSDAHRGPLDDARAEQVVFNYRERARLLPIGSSHYALPALDALRRGGQHARALVLVDEVLAVIRPRGERIFESELVRMRGELLEPTDPAAATTAYREAIVIANELGALSLELRAAVRLAAFDPSALPLVRSLYERYDEGLDTEDLVAARELLATSSP
jgi:DNA-binding winged helix-turn-helix (wHTH) protein